MPRRPAPDGWPVGSLRRRAPVQGPAGIGARPFDSADGRFNLKLAWFAGIDWGSRKHQACVLDAAGNVLGEREFEHGGAGLSQMADWLLSFAAGDEGEVGVAIETPRGPVVESLMERGLSTRSSSTASGTASRQRARRTTGATRGCSPRRWDRRPPTRTACLRRLEYRPTGWRTGHRVTGVVTSRRGPGAGTRSLSESDAAAALALLSAVPRRG